MPDTQKNPRERLMQRRSSVRSGSVLFQKRRTQLSHSISQPRFHVDSQKKAGELAGEPETELTVIVTFLFALN